MSDKFKNSKRAYLIDHRVPQLEAIPLDKLEINHYRAFLETAHVDAQIVYLKDHWGLTYYPSKLEQAQMKLGVPMNWMHEVAALLKELDIEFIAYYAIEYDEGAARRCPEWRVVNADGSALVREDLYARWSLCCYETGYRSYCLEQIAEIISAFSPDSLFLDIFGASLCYCAACKAKFRASYAYDLPTSEAEKQEHKSDILDFLEKRSNDFLDEIRACVNAYDPTVALTINFSAHYPQSVRDKLDFQFSEPLLKDNWFSAAYARDCGIGQYPMVAPGEASHVYNYKNTNSYIAELSAIAAQGCRVGMYSGSQHADGTLEFQEARMIGAAYKEIAKLEKYSEGRVAIPSVLIVQSDSSASCSPRQLISDAILRAKQKNPHLLAILGAMQLCELHKLPYRIVTEKDLPQFELEHTQLLLLPELYAVKPDVLAVVSAFVEKGGSVIASGGFAQHNLATGTSEEAYALLKFMGLKEIIPNKDFEANGWRAYLYNMRLNEAKSALSYTTPPVQQFYKVKAADAQVLAGFVLPCLAVDRKTWVNWWSPPPATQKSPFPGILRNHQGAGQAYLLAFDFFNMMSSGEFNGLADLFGDILDDAGLSFPLRLHSKHKELLRLAYYKAQGKLYIHALSDIPIRYNGETTALETGVLELLDYAVIKSARQLYPQQALLPVNATGNLQTIDLPAIELQALFEIEFEV